ncbi:hypothetical protein SmJEL517_g05252 [Synchytrium microbalum]|uniref:VWFA domain-containing protein n=1 Tax=Synchytrium microbalum TaxID=1806994 RepID=A0A507C1P3_9FUNG|nr:uncharacterized protein SmJEL517_g05252 [Synchytrium microbalum]TPX31423.1 hypothetical protein SmJEL517_g05252 [Synchytrium microbalum]
MQPTPPQGPYGPPNGALPYRPIERPLQPNQNQPMMARPMPGQPTSIMASRPLPPGPQMPQQPSRPIMQSPGQPPNGLSSLQQMPIPTDGQQLQQQQRFASRPLQQPMQQPGTAMPRGPMQQQGPMVQQQIPASQQQPRPTGIMPQQHQPQPAIVDPSLSNPMMTQPGIPSQQPLNGINGSHNSNATNPTAGEVENTALAQQMGNMVIGSKSRSKRVYAGQDAMGGSGMMAPGPSPMQQSGGMINGQPQQQPQQQRPQMMPERPLQQQASFNQFVAPGAPTQPAGNQSIPQQQMGLPNQYQPIQNQQNSQYQPAQNPYPNQPLLNPYPNQIPQQPMRQPDTSAPQINRAPLQPLQPLQVNQPVNQSMRSAAPLSATTPRSRIDPNQIPSPIAVQEADQTHYDKEPYMTLSKTVPPLASSRFRAVDEGNCNPRFIRLTTCNFPTTNELLTTSELPLGMVVQPLADLAHDEASVPIKVVDFGETGPVRCNRCKAYINPFVIFTDGGRKFTCNLCTFENDVPQEYFANLDMAGRRVDIDQRPELLFGSVEFVAPKEYCARPPQPVSYLFCIDVSWSAVQTGLVKLTADALRQIFYGERPILPSGARIGIMTYDRAVHFYSLKSTLEQAQMLVVPDVEDIFVPISEGLLVDPIESRHVIEGLLDCLHTLFESTRINDPAVGAAMQAAYIAMKEHGGKVIFTQTTIPSFGPGALVNREDVKILGTDKEKTLYEPQDNYWKKLAHDYAGSGISVDLFLFPNAYIDVATVGVVATMTGGDTFNYTNFDGPRDGLKYMNDMLRLLARTFGYESLLRIRCSNGISVKEYFGNFYMKNTTDVELAGLDSEKSIGVLLKHEGKLDERTDVSLQCAVLYTTATGQRRIRMHNTTVPVASLLGNMFRYAEMDTTINFMAKMAISQSLSAPLRTVREQITDKCVKILTAYRKHCASSSSNPGQLILPESFKLYPLYALSLLKTKAFRAGPEMSTDIRVYHMRLLRGMGVSGTIPIIYPRLFPLHQLAGETTPTAESMPSTNLPPTIRTSYERLEPSGAYLIENGMQLFIWLGRELPPPFLEAVFGVNALELVDSKMRLLPPLTSHLSTRIRGILDEVIASRSRYLQLQLVRQSLDPVLEIEFANTLVEDKNHDNMNYVDYLCAVHRSIQVEMTTT